ncbi:hypothetical protein As57867_005790, partial [Aphanomyces stellatus]
HVLNRVAKISTPIKLHAKPTMLHQAKENVFQALSALRALQLAVVPPAYIASSDLILKGQFQVIWGLLYHLMQAFQEAPTHARASTKQKQTPPEDNGSPRVADDKVLVLDWLGSHGYLKPLECAYPSFEDIEAYCQSGSLLLLLASHLTGTPSPPVVKTSVPRHMALSNIEQALEMLRGLPAMPQRFLWCEDKARTPCVILGLLQDIRSVHPHGRHRGLSMSTKASVVASSMEECRPANPPPPPAPPISPLPRRYSSIHEDALGDKDGDDDHSATDSDGDGGDLMRVWHVDTEVSSTHQWRETDIDPAEDLFPQPHHHGIDASSSSSLPPWHVDDDVIPHPQEFKLDATLEELTTWLKQLHIDVTTLDASPLVEFQNGLVLVDLVEKVEHRRRLDGVCRTPQGKRANCLHNIRKVLDILKLKKAMPLTLLRREKDIFEGNQRVILALLDQIRRVRHVCTPSAFKVSDAIPGLWVPPPK